MQRCCKATRIKPEGQLGRLETSSGGSFRLAAVTRRYNLSVPPRCLFWVESWVENRRCLESVEASAAWSGPVHPGAGPSGDSSHRCSVQRRYSKYSECDNGSRPGMGHERLPPEETGSLAG